MGNSKRSGTYAKACTSKLAMGQQWGQEERRAKVNVARGGAERNHRGRLCKSNRSERMKDKEEGSRDGGGGRGAGWQEGERGSRSGRDWIGCRICCCRPSQKKGYTLGGENVVRLGWWKEVEWSHCIRVAPSPSFRAVKHMGWVGGKEQKDREWGDTCLGLGG